MIKFLLAILLTLAPCFGQGMILNPYRFGSASGTLTLDTIATPAFAAYSVSRKLRSAYVGSAFRIRLASDGSEFDIGFDGSGNLNKTYLESTAAGTDAFIKIIYDQSGNGRDVTIATASNQPKIVSAGTCLLGSNSRAAMTLDGVDDVMNISQAISAPVTYFFVGSNASTVNNDIIVSGGSGTRVAVKQSAGDKITITAGSGFTSTTTYTPGTWYSWMAYFGADGNGSLRQNNGSLETGAVGTTSGTFLQIGSATVSPSFKFSEWIVYNAAIGTTDETTVRDNINSFYALY